MKAQNNVLGLIIGIIIALVTWVLSPEFAAEQFGIDEKTLGTVRLVATAIGIIVGAYNGNQIAKKTVR